MEGGFGSLGAMIGETRMKFSGSCTMRVSAIGRFLRNLPQRVSKNLELSKRQRVPTDYIVKFGTLFKMDYIIICV